MRLSHEYIARLAPHAKEAIASLKSRDVGVALVSGGLRDAILPLAAEVGLKQTVVHAVPVFFDGQGNYEDFDRTSLLARQGGKLDQVRRLALRPPVLAVGDGVTDSEIRPAVEAFAAYTGFVQRDSVVAIADFVINDFQQLPELVLA